MGLDLKDWVHLVKSHMIGENGIPCLNVFSLSLSLSPNTNLILSKSVNLKGFQEAKMLGTVMEDTTEF